jgi:hypothetical protein
MAKEISFLDAAGDAIRTALTPVLGKRKREDGSEAAIVGGGAAGVYRAQQMANARAAALARNSAGDASAKPAATPRLNAPATSTSLTTTGSAPAASTSLTTTGGANNLATRQPTVIRGTEMAGNELRNVTPKGGAGITGGAALLNPVAATGAALLATTQDAGRGDYVVEKGDTANTIREGAAYMQAEDTKKNMFADQRARLAEQIASGPDITDGAPKATPVMEDITAGAPKAIPVAEPMDNNRALALFNNTHGSAFDPKSSMDKKKMAAITSLMSKAGSDKLTPNQFAMQIYRTTK